MQGLAKLLVIEDDPTTRQHLSIILDFVGEQCDVIESSQTDQINWSEIWAGCILGSINGNALSSELKEKLLKANHIPLLIADKQPYGLDEFPNYVGELRFPAEFPSTE